MDLRTKLERLKAAKAALKGKAPESTGTTPSTDENPIGSSSNQALIDALGGAVFRASDLLGRSDCGTKEPPPDALELFENARRVETSSGDTVCVTHRLPLAPDDDPAPGSGEAKYEFPFRDLIPELNDADFIALANDPDFAGLGLRDLLFLDTETTGLSGGTGTYVFLVCLGWFDDDAFVVEQYFMEDYDREPALMEVVADRIRQFRAFVTYNGKNFDVPLLRTRFLFNRLRDSLDLPDLDLLYPARRIWKEALPNCSLSQMEDSVLRLPERQSDVSGALVPRIFIDYARGVRRQRVIPVFDHNAQDVISLASLLALQARMLRDPDAAPVGHSLEMLGLGRLLERAGRPDDALERMERALLIERDAQRTFMISCRIARLYKKQERFVDAADIWASHIETPRAYNIIAFEELAKHLEHRVKDFAAASEITTRARDYCAAQSELFDGLGRYDEAESIGRWTPSLEKRLNRLTGKIERHGPSVDG